MLAYAPRPDRPRVNSPALAFIVAVHAVAIVAVMSAKMAITPRDDGPTIVESYPIEPPKPVKPEPRKPNPAPNHPISAPDPLVPLLPMPGPVAEPLPPLPIPGPIAGPSIEPAPKPAPIVRTGPRFATPEADIRPPYPESKRELDQEATLRLRLAINERGRVVAVEPVGKADPAFLAAARRHILRAWRYQPAKDGDRAIASSTVVSLEFRLD